jgi:acyl-CoA synthetase (AMP-forming)/AMP-acid ligase II
VVALFGILRCPCSVLLLNPNDPEERLREQEDSLRVKAILRDPRARAEGDAAILPDPVALPETRPTDPFPDLDPTSDALYFGTSGSTAASKLVAQSHHSATVNAEAVRRHYRLEDSDRLLGCLPIHHVNGVHFTLFATLASGAHAILTHAFDPFAYPAWIERFRPHIASVVPSVLEALLATWRRPALPSEFRYFVSAAAPLAARTVSDVRQAFHIRILQGYGLTETTNFSTTVPPEISERSYQLFMEEADIPTIGAALYGNKVSVLTPDGRSAPSGQIGEICIRGHNVMTRYVGNESATSEAFRGGWFHSQDLGYAVTDSESGHEYFVITGRTKNIAKVRGETVSLDEVDRALRALPYVRDAACVSVPHRLVGEEIIAVVAYSTPRDDGEMLGDLARTLSPSSLPRRIVRLSAIPRTVTGKIRRSELARQLAPPDQGGPLD